MRGFVAYARNADPDILEEIRRGPAVATQLGVVAAAEVPNQQPDRLGVPLANPGVGLGFREEDTG